MLLVRYVALAALVVWLGGMIVVTAIVAPATFDVLQAVPTQGQALAGVLVGDILGRFHLLSYACGGVVFVSLFVMKFVGPPPAGFVPRAAIVAAMLASTAYSGLVVSPQVEAMSPHASSTAAAANALHQRSALLMTLNIALGSVLLLWYARE